jgi:single-strand DNA-binding protein
MSLNKVILQGNLVADPECRVTPNGTSVCSFRVAIGRRFAKEGAEVQADFFTIEAWKNTADFISKHFVKGRQIIIIGSIQNRNWTDQNGQKRYGDVIIADEVYFAGSKGVSSDTATVSESNSSERVTPNFEEIGSEDDLPF